MNGQELRQILRKMGVKQVDLATKMGISPQHLTSLLQAASVKISTLERIAQAVGKEVSELLTDDSEVARLKAEVRRLQEENAELRQAQKIKDETIANLVLALGRK